MVNLFTDFLLSWMRCCDERQKKKVRKIEKKGRRVERGECTVL